MAMDNKLDPAAKQRGEARNRAKTDQVGAQVANATQGIDLQRIMAVGDRFETQKCPTPTGPAPQ